MKIRRGIRDGDRERKERRGVGDGTPEGEAYRENKARKGDGH